jgi:hypothetical protein
MNKLHAHWARVLCLVREQLQTLPQPFKVLSLVGDLELLQQAIGMFMTPDTSNSSAQRTVIFEECGPRGLPLGAYFRQRNEKGNLHLHHRSQLPVRILLRTLRALLGATSSRRKSRRAESLQPPVAQTDKSPSRVRIPTPSSSRTKTGSAYHSEDVHLIKESC